MTKTKSMYLAVLAVLLSPMVAHAGVIVDYPLDNSEYGWDSNRGAQQIAEFFTVGSAATATEVSWYGFWDGALLDTFDIHFFADIAGTPDTVAFAMETIAGLTGTDTGLDNNGGFRIFEWTTAITGVLLAVDDYWISIRGISGSIFTWSHSVSDGSGTVYARFADAAAWQEIGTGTRDLQSLRIISAVPEPGTLALLGIGLFGMGLARRKKV